ncbi:MAG: twin-arginine translocase subunit TatC [Nitrospirae bacterium]|nr:twin-arginine translocase subunit TatC [Nitrospirota bacterium]
MTNEKMSFTGHLTELRKRLIVSIAALIVGFSVSFNFSEDIFRFLMIPMEKDVLFKFSYPFVSFADRSGAPIRLVFLAPAEAFWMHLKISLTTGIFLSAPVILYQVWRFISPGLFLKEKKYAVPFMLSATVLFLLGGIFCFFIVLPFALKFLLTYKTSDFLPMISIGNYIDFCLKFILAFGIVFELPVVIVFLTRMGIVSPQTLAKNRKYAVLIAFVLAAILTPTPDAFNQTLMAVPIIFLYEGGILVSRLLPRRK